MWKKVKDELPTQDRVVDTKIDDKEGVRNEQQLKLIGSMWYNTDGKMYVYYTPTHWKYPE